MHTDTPDFIEKHTYLKAPLARVWAAISRAEEFGLWFGMRFDNPPFEVGKHMKGFIVPTTVNADVAAMQKNYEGTPIDWVVIAIEPETLLQLSWHPYALKKDYDYSVEPMTLISFKLTECEGGVDLRVTESGFNQIPLDRRAEALRANDGGWAKQMELIEAYLAL